MDDQRTVKLLAPFGFYGWGNIGDEATLQGFARLVARSPQQFRVWLGSRNPKHTALVEPSFRYFHAGQKDWRRWWANCRSDALVFPGGTPIMDVLGEWPFCELVPILELANSRGKPVVFIGTGTERLERDESKRLFGSAIAPRVRHWSVRCARDKNRLTAYGVAAERITVAGDMAWLLEPQSKDFGKRLLEKLGIVSNERLIAVNINSEAFMLKKEPNLCEKIGRFLDTAIERYGFHALFLCNEVREDKTFDKATSLAILGSMKRQDRALLVPNEYRTPQQMMSIIGCCDATISSRFHFCLFSALQGVPFLAIQRSDKVEDLCWDMDWPCGVSLENLSVPILSDFFQEICHNAAALRDSLLNKSEFMRERALKSSLTLDVLAGS